MLYFSMVSCPLFPIFAPLQSPAVNYILFTTQNEYHALLSVFVLIKFHMKVQSFVKWQCPFFISCLCQNTYVFLGFCNSFADHLLHRFQSFARSIVLLFGTTPKIFQLIGSRKDINGIILKRWCIV